MLQMLKRGIVGVLGRERANRLSAPYHDWQARRRTAKTLASLPTRDLLVNLGCGPSPLAGWINVDIARGPQVDLVWNLQQGLPFADNSCSAIFSEHVIEHLTKQDGEQLLRECHRVLQKGGVLRISTPDAGRFLRSYAGDREFLSHPSFPEPAESAVDRVNMMMREGGQHLWVYDNESLLKLIQRTGFASASEQKFGVSQHPGMQNIDLQMRAFESLYVEAVK